MEIKDLILKTDKINWQNLQDLQPINFKNNYHAEKVKRSIIDNGFANTIYCWEDKKGNFFIIDGHCRRDVLNQLKSEGFDIPEKLNCTFLDLPNKKIAVKYLLQVFNQKTNPINEIALNNWMEDLDVSLDDISINIDDLHIDLKTEEIEEKDQIKQDEVQEVEKSFVVRGDLFELIDEEQDLTHRVLCGDSTIIDDVNKVMNGKKADSLQCDPPYGVDYSSKNEFLNKYYKGNRNKKVINNDSLKNYRKFFNDFLSIIPFADYNTIYCWMSSLELHNLRLSFDDCKIKWGDYLVWVKNNHVLGRKDYNAKHEFCVYGWKDKHKFYGDFSTTILEFDKPLKNDLHPTMKPIALISKLIKDGCKEKGLVYDPFLGSGSTLIACQQTKRNCYGIELDQHYCSVIVIRWLNFMNKQNKKAIVKRNGEVIDEKELLN